MLRRNSGVRHTVLKVLGYRYFSWPDKNKSYINAISEGSGEFGGILEECMKNVRPYPI